MALTGKVRARLAAAVESALRGIVTPGRLGRGCAAGGSNIEPLERRMMLSSTAGVEISGQSVGFVGKTLTFNADLSPDLAGGSPAYQWNLLNQYGSTYVPPGGLQNTALSSLVLPGNLPAGNYEVTLAISESGIATQNATFPIEVLNDPQGNLIYGPVPSVGGALEGYVSAMVRQGDGKIVAAGYWGTQGADDDGNDPVDGWWIARFNPDLTLDTSFQNHHADSFFQPNGAVGDFTSVQRLAINPTNGDVIVVGTGGSTASQYNLQVAELLSNDTVVNGHVYHAGAFDPMFAGGEPYVYAATPVGSQAVNTCGEDVAISSVTGDLLVGGGLVGVTTDQTLSPSDFLLLALKPDGTLDTGFNPQGSVPGVAAQPGVSGAYGSGDTSEAYAPSRITSLAVDAQGNIYAGGVGSPPSGSADQEGIVLVKYASNGSIASGFGTGGADYSYTDGSQFHDPSSGAPDASAFLSSMELLPNGDLLVVGSASGTQADPNLQYGALPDMVEAHAILAEYSTSSGRLDTAFGTGGTGIVDTGISFNSMTLLGDGPLMPPSSFVGDSWFPQNLGSFAFEPDGSVVGSLETTQLVNGTATDLGWQIVKFVGDDGVATDAGTLQSSFTVNAPATDGEFDPYSYPGTVLAGSDGVIVGGTFYQTNQPGKVDGASEDGITNLEQPLLVRQLLQAPAATGLKARQTSSGAVSLAWSVSEPGQTGFTVERSDSLDSNGALDDPVQVLDQLGPTQTDYLDATALPAKQYYYQVVPIYSPDGAQQPGTATAILGIYTADAAGANNLFQEAIQVPLDGSPVTSMTMLQAGQYYVIKASGLIKVNAQYVPPGDPNNLDSSGNPIPEAMQADPAYWYDLPDPQQRKVYKADGNQLTTLAPSSPFAATSLSYGVAVGPMGGTLAVPDWGAIDADHHSYTYIVQGSNAQLSFQLQGAAQLGFPASPSGDDKPFEIEIYEVNGTPVTPPPSAARSPRSRRRSTTPRATRSRRSSPMACAWARSTRPMARSSSPAR